MNVTMFQNYYPRGCDGHRLEKLEVCVLPRAAPREVPTWQSQLYYGIS